MAFDAIKEIDQVNAAQHGPNLRIPAATAWSAAWRRAAVLARAKKWGSLSASEDEDAREDEDAEEAETPHGLWRTRNVGFRSSVKSSPSNGQSHERKLLVRGGGSDPVP